MNKGQVDQIEQLSRQVLQEWIVSCTRHSKIARSTVAMGIVVLDHLRHRCPVQREEVISEGGEVSGARSRLRDILESYGIPRTYLKEVTTRQGPQDGQRLFDLFGWGTLLAQMSDDQRDALLLELIGSLKKLADEWLTRPNLRLDIDRGQAPTTWVNLIVESARGHSGGIVEQQLVGAKLARRFKNLAIPNHPAHAADRQTERVGDFAVSKLAYHVTAAPSMDVLQKCAENLRLGLQPILLVPCDQKPRARAFAEAVGVEMSVVIASIEDFVALNIIELATEENKDFFTILQEIVEVYNKRLAEVETDLALRIEVR